MYPGRGAPDSACLKYSGSMIFLYFQMVFYNVNFRRERRGYINLFPFKIIPEYILDLNTNIGRHFNATSNSHLLKRQCT